MLETDLNLDQQSIDNIDSETINVTESRDIVLDDIISKISDYIVQLENITNEASLSSLEEFRDNTTSEDHTKDKEEN